MTYRIEMPFVRPQMEQFSVDRWDKRPGDSIAFGDVVCTLSVLAEDKASSLTWLQRRKLRKFGATALGTARARVNVIAQEPGVLKSTEVPEGGVVLVGGTLGEVENPGGGSGQFCVDGAVVLPSEERI